MFYRILMFTIGVILFAIGITFLIMYLSLFSMGFTLNEFLIYFMNNGTFYLLPLGLLMIMVSLFFDSKWKRFILWRKDRLRSSRE